MNHKTIIESQDYIDLVKSLQAQDFEKALTHYVQLFETYPSSFDLHNNTNAIPNLTTHVNNMASLSRKCLYDKSLPFLSVSARLQSALDMMVGISNKQFSDRLQQPNFFYVPKLTAKPFYEPNEIPGLNDCVNALTEVCKLYSSHKTELPDSYINNMGKIPKGKGWEQLANKEWGSQHLIRGGEILEKNQIQHSLSQFKQCRATANCPPHAPEVFISRLEPDTVIPAHYGISNIKLTVHLPINVNTACELTAGEQTRKWDEHTNIIIFDDSFLHTAQNKGSEARTVLIFDVWHPDLNEQERNAITQFMAIYHDWNQRTGKLAGLDRGMR